GRRRAGRPWRPVVVASSLFRLGAAAEADAGRFDPAWHRHRARGLRGGPPHGRVAGVHARACCPASGQPRMIVGIGSDLIDIRRIEKTLERHGERFIARIFTDIERRKSEARRERAASYAKRFAAKEACAKALGTGLSRGVFWRD